VVPGNISLTNAIPPSLYPWKVHLSRGRQASNLQGDIAIFGFSRLARTSGDMPMVIQEQILLANVQSIPALTISEESTPQVWIVAFTSLL
jgi:hypothetical protein